MTGPGEILSTISTTLFAVLEVRYAAGTAATVCSRESSLLMFAAAGAYVECRDEERHAGDDSTALMIEKNQPCVLQFQEETRCMFITPRGESPPAEIDLLVGRCRRLRRSSLKPLLRSVCAEARRNDASAPLALNGAVFTLLAELLRISAGELPPSSLGRSLRLLHGVRGEDVTVAELARVSGLSVKSFRRRFKEQTGCTFALYRRRLRIERAKELLRTTPKLVREISRDVGFSDPGHFSNVFARHVGMSPVDYRRVHA